MQFQLHLILFVMVYLSQQTCRSEGCWWCTNYKDCCDNCKCWKSQKYQKTIDTFGCDKNKCDDYDNGKCDKCVDGYYLKNYVCYLCTYPCIECSSYSCKKCAQGYNLSNGKCISCSMPLCKSCAMNSNQCQYCVDDAYFLDSSKTACKCNDTYFSDGKQCKQCNQICLACVSSFDVCSSCKNLANMSQSPINGKCRCNDGYYWNSNSCQQCIAPCATCEDQAISCTTCNNQTLIVNDDNKCICKEGYLSSPNNPYQCELCQINCFTCEDFNNKCTSCYENYLLNDDTNTCFCPEGFYEVDNTCNECPKLCSKCLSDKICIECIENMLVIKQNQVCKCSDGYFFDKIESQCQQCDSICNTCSNKQTCDSCHQEMNRTLDNGKCICQKNYFLNENQLCISCQSKEAITVEFCKYKDCNDGIWSYGEECDDANYSSRDGCFNCSIEPFYYCINKLLQPSICQKCQENCAVCEYDQNQQNSKCKQAIDGYYIENSTRINKCLDKCLHCKFTSSQCTKCRFLNISKSDINCQLCEYKQGYYSDYENNLCYSKCGDAILADIEQCDDGNQINGDGCSNRCILEKNFDCVNGICSKTKNPIPSAQENSIYDLYTKKRQVLITYDQELNFTQQFELNDELQIQMNQEANLNIFVKSNLNFPQENITNFTITIEIEVDRSITNASLLIKYLNPQLFKNTQNQFQEINFIEVKITDIVIISQSAQALTASTVNSSNYIIYCLLALLGCGLILGDTLQYLSYLYYINTVFPFNVNQFFENLNFAQFTIVQDFIKLDDIFEYNFDYDLELHSLTVPFKIKNQGMYSCFLLNFASIFSVFLIAFTFYTIAIFIKYKILSSEKQQSLKDQQSNSKFKMYYLILGAKLQHFAYQWAIVIIREFFYSDLLRIFMTTANEYSFTLGLGLKGLDFSTKFGSINSITTFIFLAFYILITFISFKIVDKKRYALQQFQYSVKFGSVVSGLKISKYQKLYNPLLLIKKFLFMAFLIYLYDYPIIQVLQVTLLSLTTLIALITYQPIKERLELIKQITCETSQFVTLVFFTFFCINDLIKFLNEDQKLIIGWIVISNVLTALFTQLVINSIQQWRYLYIKYEFIRKIVNKCVLRCQKKQLPQASHDVFL
ncbi:unnamed protein product [Paramecium sonneborni]|uniref:EGF-like domain-containing protein n=1 Tax=Paramecium sonneborni TaxID=65129 RepID=A0A8S1JZE4_9CILI|nr:unnamed protein product [Paramecium sonneborni]